jgi:5'-3' exonuclease
VLSLGLSEDYDVGRVEEGSDYLHHGSGRGEREQSNRRAARDEKERVNEKTEKKPVGKWIHLQIFSRLEVEARGEVTGTGKKLALKLRVLF